MPLERRLSRDAFLQNEIVILKQLCLTPSQMFQPGRYVVKDLPDEAFTMGLVERAPITSEEDKDSSQ